MLKNQRAEQAWWYNAKYKNKTQGDYHIHCSKDVYFGALLFLTPYRIRHRADKRKHRWGWDKVKEGGRTM